jgi:hypothetical protein
VKSAGEKYLPRLEAQTDEEFVHHYRLRADYRRGMHFTALPTAWVSGFDKAATLRIGSSTAWVTDTPGASAGFLEYTGQGLTTFERAMDRDEKLMAILGARLLESQKRVGEAAAGACSWFTGSWNQKGRWSSRQREGVRGPGGVGIGRRVRGRASGGAFDGQGGLAVRV